VTEKRGPGAENRHGGAPRGERPASWDARRLARRLACRVTCTPTGVSQTPERLSALRPPLNGVSEAKRQSPDAAMRVRERAGLFDIVNVVIGRAAISVRSSPRGAPRDGKSAFTRVYDALCVAGTPLRGPMIPAPAKAGTGRCLWVPALPPLSRRSAGTTLVGWRERPTCGCTKSPPAQFPLFRIVINNNELCNSNVSRRGVPSLLTRCDRTDGRWWRSRRAAGRSRCCRARHSGRRRCCRCRAPPTTSRAARCCCRFARSRPAFARRRA
jgi:hypothetical protein